MCAEVGNAALEGMITLAITEPERVIHHFKTTRKSGFACIALLSGVLGDWREFESVYRNPLVVNFAGFVQFDF